MVMNIPQILQGMTSTDGKVRKRATQALRERLVAIARQSLSSTPDHERDDVVQRVFIKLWTMVEDDSYGVVSSDGYVRSMIVNGLRDHIRAEVRQRGHIDALRRVAPIPGDLQAEPLSETELARQLSEKLELLVVTVEAARSPRFKENVRRDVDQLVAMAAEHVTMDDAIAEEWATTTNSEKERKAARDRVLKRHERIRRDLGDAIERLEKRGDVSSEEAVELRGVCTLLLRCQRSEPADVSRNGSEER
jgi:DNA-directed RNA polymerase specialized sigma24 family protein